LRGEVIVVWDNGPNHKGEPLRELRAAYPRLDIEWLPPYAPELNPVELLWNCLKYQRLVNFTPPNLENLAAIKFDQDRLKTVYAGTPLQLPERTLIT
jgi:transposase